MWYIFHYFQNDDITFFGQYLYILVTSDAFVVYFVQKFELFLLSLFRFLTETFEQIWCFFCGTHLCIIIWHGDHHKFLVN